MGKVGGKVITLLQSELMSVKMIEVAKNYTSHIFEVVLASLSVLVWCASRSVTARINSFKI